MIGTFPRGFRCLFKGRDAGRAAYVKRLELRRHAVHIAHPVTINNELPVLHMLDVTGQTVTQVTQYYQGLDKRAEASPRDKSSQRNPSYSHESGVENECL